MAENGERPLLRLLHVDPERLWGGGEAQVFGLLSYLVERGHDVELAAHPEGALAARCKGLGLTTHALIARNDLDLRSVPMLRRVIRENQFDVVHLHTKRAHALALWLPHTTPKPKYVVTRRMDYPEKRNRYTDLLYNRKVDAVVAISRNIASSLCAAGVRQDRISLIYSGIEVDRFTVCGKPRADQPHNEIVIGSLGVLEERKGHRDLLTAAAVLKQRGLKFRYRVGGAGGLRELLQQQAQELGIADLVEFTGFVDDVPHFMSSLDLFVMPSRFEGLGVAVLEAMAAGKAVIASSVGGLAESVIEGETGLLVPPGQPDAIAAAIERLAANESLRTELGLSGAKRARENFSMATMARQNEALYYAVTNA